MKKSTLTQLTCIAFSFAYIIAYAFIGDSDLFIASTIYLAASFIIGALEK
jgi:hypothetical protein